MSNLHKQHLTDQQMLIDAIRQRTALIEALAKAAGQAHAIEVLAANTRYMDREDVELTVTNALNGETFTYINMLENGE